MPRYFFYCNCWLSLAFAAGCSQPEREDKLLLTENDVGIHSNNNLHPQTESLPSTVAGDEYRPQRLSMVEHQIRKRGIRDNRVLTAMYDVPRHLFVPLELAESAYEDRPLPIGYDQTISQPYIVALMTELVRPQDGDRALDIGTGCGYQAAVLARLVRDVYSIEIIEQLANQAARRLADLEYSNVHVRHGDGYRGWPEKAPFDIIVVAAAPDHIPQALVDQLAPGGRLVIPVGRRSQDLKLIEKDASGNVMESQIAAVRFVPMTGEAESN